MKAITLSTLLLLITVSCTTQDALEDKGNWTGSAKKKNADTLPTNPLNTYDAIGNLYFNLLENYYSIETGNQNLSMLISTVETAAFQNTNFLALPGTTNYIPLTTVKVQTYLNAANGDIAVLLDPKYNYEAVAVYREITVKLDSLKRNDKVYSDVYNTIIEIEQGVIDSNTIPDKQKAAVLVTTAILRNAMYHDTKRRRRDRDWEWMTTNIAATANAALESQPQAITIALVTDLHH